MFSFTVDRAADRRDRRRSSRSTSSSSAADRPAWPPPGTCAGRGCGSWSWRRPAELGHTWRTRWESLRLFTPAEYDALPGLPFPAPAGTYPGKEAVADYLRDYAAAFDLPVRAGRAGHRAAAAPTTASRLSTADRDVHRPAGRSWPPDRSRPRSSRRSAAGLDESVTQLHSADYRSPRRPARRARCWSSAAATPASRSPRSWPPPGRSSCRSARPTRRCRSGCSAATCSGG